MENKKTDAEQYKDIMINIINKNDRSMDSIHSEIAEEERKAKIKFKEAEKEMLENTEWGISENDPIDAQGYIRDDISDDMFNHAYSKVHSLEEKHLEDIDNYQKSKDLLSLEIEDAETPEQKKEIENYIEEVNEYNNSFVEKEKLENDTDIKYVFEELKDEFETVNDINESLWITPDDNMLTGDYDMGVRGTDHRALLDYYDLDRDNEESWDKIHETGFIRIVPETKKALIYEDQKISSKQKSLVENNNFEFESYGTLDTEKDDKNIESNKVSTLRIGDMQFDYQNMKSDSLKEFSILDDTDNLAVEYENGDTVDFYKNAASKKAFNKSYKTLENNQDSTIEDFVEFGLNKDEHLVEPAKEKETKKKQKYDIEL